MLWKKRAGKVCVYMYVMMYGAARWCVCVCISRVCVVCVNVCVESALGPDQRILRQRAHLREPGP